MRWSLLSLVLFIVSAVGFGVGIGWWINPGAGIAAGSIMVGLIALFYDDGKSR